MANGDSRLLAELAGSGATITGNRIEYCGIYVDLCHDSVLNAAWIREFRSTYDSGRGGARAMMRRLCDAADIAGVTLRVRLLPDGTGPGRCLTEPALAVWYYDYLFQDAADGDGLERLPPGQCRIRLPFLRKTRAAAEADDPLAAFFVWWCDIGPELCDEFERVLESASDEQTIQRFLEDHPLILVQPLGGGHGRWVIPQQRLGCEHVTDFMVAEASSIGVEWYAVELESPRAKMFNRNGDPSRTLVHAQRQIFDWRDWISRNRDYASRPRDEKGLGLTDVHGGIPGIIIMGRRRDLPGNVKGLRAQYEMAHRIRTHTFDWLLERARDAASHSKHSPHPG